MQPVEGGKGGVDIAVGASLQDFNLRAFCVAARRGSPTVASLIGFFGLTRKPITLACGTSSVSSSIRFCVNSSSRMLMPVRLPPGLARLAARPCSTGLPTLANTIGIAVVAPFAAIVGGLPPPATITIDPAGDKLGGHARKPIKMPVGPSGIR